MKLPRREAYALIAIIGVAAAARVLLLVVLPPGAWVDGSDTPFYVRQAWKLAHGQSPLFATVAPAYSWLLAAVWTLFRDSPFPESAGAIPVAFLTTVRIIQVALGVGMIAAAFALAYRLTRSPRAALVTAAGLAIGPAFVAEPFRILTETLFLALLTAGLLLFVSARERPAQQIPAGIVFGLAALTRPVVAALPILLALLLWSCGTGLARRWRALVLLAAFGVTVAPWSFALRRQTGSWFPPGLTANLWIGSVGEGRWQGSAALDALRARFRNGPDDYVGEVAAQIGTSPGEWLLVRARNFSAALAQPHFASDVPGPSTKEALSRWWHTDRRPGALAATLSERGAALKLVLYAWHWLAMAAGLAGLWRWRGRWREVSPLWAVVLYFPVVHLFLTALPRYLFPIQPALWIAAALSVTSPDPADLSGGAWDDQGRFARIG